MKYTVCVFRLIDEGEGSEVFINNRFNAHVEADNPDEAKVNAADKAWIADDKTFEIPDDYIAGPVFEGWLDDLN